MAMSRWSLGGLRARPGSARLSSSAKMPLIRPSPMLWGSVAAQEVGGAGLDWANMSWDYIPTNGHVRHVWKDGKWDQGGFFRDPYMTVHILANVFHYGQAIFEGFKVFHTADGEVCSFIDHLSLERMTRGCRRLHITPPTPEIWLSAVDELVCKNVDFVPPYGTGGALYLRPFIFGSGPKLGLGPSKEYTFGILCNPVGNYYQTGQLQSLDAMISDEFDRAAPKGAGDVKCAGNYAADLDSMFAAKQRGFPISLYLDSKEGRYIEEFNTSNFVAITKDGTYLTPHAPRSILRSNTNRVLMQLASDMGIKVEERAIDFDKEVDSFAEVGAVGTAVVMTPIRSVTRGERKHTFDEPNVLRKLYDKVKAVQIGDDEDLHGWRRSVPVGNAQTVTTKSIYPPL
uniref:Branched-chain-amino-acid transaminase n=1 Tax=Noctiluca scintillans TaxID=2966 RepID=A0A7S1A3Y6_NOCSC|mmetsp:Transcript_29755/g.79061  ORF Transcript_29755/g.79061 Transcript_29755/m.79061 type:complete len:399 (+) Transcript_29755:77-1273(+)